MVSEIGSNCIISRDNVQQTYHLLFYRAAEHEQTKIQIVLFVVQYSIDVM